MIRLRQVALVTSDLEAVLGDLNRMFGLEVAFRDPGVDLEGSEQCSPTVDNLRLACQPG